MSKNQKIDRFKCEDCKQIFDTEPAHVHYDASLMRLSTWCDRCWEDHHEFPISSRTFKHREEGVKYVFDLEKPRIEQILKGGVPAWEKQVNLTYFFDSYYIGDDPNGWVVFYKIDTESCVVKLGSYDEVFRAIELRILKEEWGNREHLKKLFEFYRRFEYVDDRWSDEANQLLNDECPGFHNNLVKRYNNE